MKRRIDYFFITLCHVHSAYGVGMLTTSPIHFQSTIVITINIESGHNNQDSVLVFVTMGLLGSTAIPTENLYSLLLSAGAGRGLQEWRNAPSTYVNYVLAGIPTFGVGTGAESYAASSWRPATMRTGAYFYKDFSNLPYEGALDTAPTFAEAEAIADSEPEHHEHELHS